MAMPKRDIRMTRPEVMEFLSRQTDCVVGFNSGRPAPGVVLARYHLRGDRLEIGVPQAAAGLLGSGTRAMLAALIAEPRVCVLVEQSPSYYEIAYVSIRGPVDSLREADGMLVFDLAVGDVASASFAKLLGPVDVGTA
jgi:nitroimidazol reductase NimA-like FMN-containing flavoprotein (pyridoxamine 5'-phosphate oxidase superfamily)